MSVLKQLKTRLREDRMPRVGDFTSLACSECMESPVMGDLWRGVWEKTAETRGGRIERFLAADLETRTFTVSVGGHTNDPTTAAANDLCFGED